MSSIPTPQRSISAALILLVLLAGCRETEPAAPGEAWIRPSDGMIEIYVPGGSFQMGSTEAEIE